MTMPSKVMRAQVERGMGIPRELYLSTELFDREIDGIFNRSLLYAGHESHLDAPGAYLTVESGAESVIVTRTANHDLAAFHNVCRHRGARLVDTGCGRNRFVCPYHQWPIAWPAVFKGHRRCRRASTIRLTGFPRFRWHHHLRRRRELEAGVGERAGVLPLQRQPSRVRPHGRCQRAQHTRVVQL